MAQNEQEKTNEDWQSMRSQEFGHTFFRCAPNPCCCPSSIETLLTNQTELDIRWITRGHSQVFSS